MRMRTSRTGSNVVRVGSYNQAVVLDVIRRAKSISRVELANLTGLASQTVTNICRRLLDDGFIVEAGKVATGFGKPRTALEPKRGSYHAVGVLLDPDASSIVLLDLAGQVRHRARFSHSQASAPAQVIEAIQQQVSAMLRQAQVETNSVVGIGIGAPGPIDFAEGKLVHPVNLPRWQDEPIQQMIAEATGYATVLDKDVVAAAVAESWYGSGERQDTTAVIYVGTGIGLGLCLEGEVFRGATGNAGEVGHIIVDADGPSCRCGRRGCIASVSAPSTLVERSGDPGKGVYDAMTELMERAGSEDSIAGELSRAADGLLVLADSVASLYDVNSVVFGGPMWAHFEGLLTRARLEQVGEHVSAQLLHPVHCRASALAGDFGAIGAACLVFDRFLSPRTAQLMLRPGRRADSMP